MEEFSLCGDERSPPTSTVEENVQVVKNLGKDGMAIIQRKTHGDIRNGGILLHLQWCSSRKTITSTTYFEAQSGK
ncbi:hypothetical protein TNCV_2603171 [Trichonephila clavipes]|nr:hypothetical protein TNCV_2603171 [Trichonephila clavipes]